MSSPSMRKRSDTAGVSLVSELVVGPEKGFLAPIGPGEEGKIEFLGRRGTGRYAAACFG